MKKGGKNLVLSNFVTGMRLLLIIFISECQAVDHYQTLGALEPGNLIPAGIWTLADVLQYGREKGVCPYFTVRRMVNLLFLLR